MHPLADLLRKNEAWLMRRVRDYALEQGYTRYTSTLEEAWRISIRGLTDSIEAALEISDEPWEPGPEEGAENDPVGVFGIFEAKMHRCRGITLWMFLGLMKYYRKSFLDLLARTSSADSENAPPGSAHPHARFVECAFDRLEMAFCAEWSRDETVNTAIDELQAANRTMTNEKNRFLTIFESLPTAVFVLDDQGGIVHMNQAGALLVDPVATCGGHYYSRIENRIPFPWLSEALSRFRRTGTVEAADVRIAHPEKGERLMKVRFQVMQDVSFKFPGTVVIFEDITDLKRTERALIEARDALRDRASHDPLTGLWNRGEIVPILKRQLARTQREGGTVSVIMADLDYFKQVNDNYGHVAGDVVLRQVAGKMVSLVRDYDYVGRYGGEEFLVVLPGADRDSAAVFSERIRTGIEKESIAIPGGEIAVTISLGVACRENGQRSDADKLIQQADQALYLAKKNGRNRVEMSE